MTTRHMAAALYDHNRRKKTEAQDYAYDTSAWVRMLFQAEADEHGDLGRQAAEGGERPETAGVLRELFARQYGGFGTSPKAEPEEWARQLHEAASKQPGWDELLKRCSGDSWLAGMAASNIWRSVKRLLPPPEGGEEDGEGDGPGGPGGNGPGGDGPGRRTQQLNEAVKKLADSGELHAATKEGVARGLRHVEDGGDAMDAMDAGVGAGNPQRREVIRKLRASSKLRRIVALAGRFRAAATTKRAAKRAVGGSEETVGVTVGGDMRRLVGGELVNFCDPTRAGHLYQRVMAHKALVYELNGLERSVRGSVLILLDVSGSMDGERNTVAKALAWGIADTLRKERRAFAFVHFDGYVQPDGVFAFGPGEVDHVKLADALSFFSGGGTQMSPPLKTAADLIVDPSSFPVDGRPWHPAAKADVLFITDGSAYDVTETAMELQRLERAGASIYSLFIGRAIQPGSSGELIAQASHESVLLSEDNVYALAQGRTDSVDSVLTMGL